MNGFPFSSGSLDFFGLDIDRLAEFVEATLLQAAVATDMGNDLQFLAVGIGLNAGVGPN